MAANEHGLERRNTDAGPRAATDGLGAPLPAWVADPAMATIGLRPGLVSRIAVSDALLVADFDGLPSSASRIL
jgi:hypothetical protein